MLKSMTGFGRAEFLSDEQYEIKIQIKSVNHRYADVTVKTPRIYSYIEDFIRIRVSSVVFRGKIEISVNINKLNDSSKQIKLNKSLAKSYIENLKLLSEYGVSDDISMSTLSTFPDIFEVEYKEIDEEKFTEMITPVLESALNNYLDMCTNEGERLKKSIVEHLNSLSAEVDKIELRSPQTVTEYKDRLYKRLTDTLSTLDINVDDSRILTEVALFSDKVAVDEETVRLKSHIKEFKDAMELDGPVGKKLDFIVQEMNRETNTIGSKANDFELSKIVVEMKSIIEKIREQIQNIE